MNSAIGPSFKEKFVEFHTCEFREQCTRPSKKKHKRAKRWSATVQTHTQAVKLTQLWLEHTFNQ